MSGQNDSRSRARNDGGSCAVHHHRCGLHPQHARTKRGCRGLIRSRHHVDPVNDGRREIICLGREIRRRLGGRTTHHHSASSSSRDAGEPDILGLNLRRRQQRGS
jgi:hypothetical protein